MYRLGLTLLLAFTSLPAHAVTPDPKSLEVPAGENLRARELIHRLGSDSYSEREHAQRTLSQMGRLAKPALAEAVSLSQDPEVLRRVVRLLPRALDEEMKARVAVFLADKEGRYRHDFPGWTPFREIVGNSLEARSLFGEMIRDSTNAQLLAAMEGPREELLRRFHERRQQVWNWKYPRTPDSPRKEPVMPDLVTLLLVDTHSATKSSSGVSVAAMFTNTAFVTGSLDGARGEVVKKLLNRWLVSRDDANFLYQALNVANRFELSGATACAAKLLAQPAAAPYLRGTAISTITRGSAREYLPAIEKCLGDETICTRTRPPGAVGANDFIEVRVQDLALAAAVTLTGQKLEDYKLKEWTVPGPVGVKSRYLPYHIRAEDRAAALEKWKQWRKNHPDPEPMGGKTKD